MTASECHLEHLTQTLFPILRGLSLLVNDPRRDVRGVALTGVFECMRRGACDFDCDVWRLVFNTVIKPLFDDIHHQLWTGGQAHDGMMAMGPTTCLTAITELVKVVAENLTAVSFLLDDVLSLIVNFVQHNEEGVARIGVEGLKQLLASTGKMLQADNWRKATAVLLHLFEISMPTKLLHSTGEPAQLKELPFEQQAVVIQCVVHLLLIDTVQDTVTQYYDVIPEESVLTLVDALQGSLDFARNFNGKIELRMTLKKLGFMREMRQLPGLLKQEREALSCSLRLLFCAHTDPRMADKHASSVRNRLYTLAVNVLSNYAVKERLSRQPHEFQANAGSAEEAVVVETEREVSGLAPIVSDVLLAGLRDLSSQEFMPLAPGVFPMLCDLVLAENPEIRLAVRAVLTTHIRPVVDAASAAR